MFSKQTLRLFMVAALTFSLTVSTQAQVDVHQLTKAVSSAAEVIQGFSDFSSFQTKSRGGGSRGGSSRSWGSRSSSRSSSKSSGSKSWGSGSKKSSAAPSKPKAAPTKTNPLTGKKTSTKADKAAYEKAAKSGKAFKTKDAAAKDFKSRAKTDPKVQQKLAKDYPTKYDKKPETRPSHIPQTYNNQTVVYQNGGYGYAGPNGFTLLTSYMLLDTMSDAMMYSAMANHGYHVGGAPAVVHHQPGIGIGMIILIIFLVVCGVVFLAILTS